MKYKEINNKLQRGLALTVKESQDLYQYIKTLEQEPILDKIREEIDEQYDRVHPYNIWCAEGLEMALGIIDKYKAEMEDKG